MNNQSTLITAPFKRVASACLLLTGLGLQSAFAEGGLDVMQGFPPPAEQRVTKANAFQSPYLRWATSHARELSPTRNVARAESPLVLKNGEPQSLGDLAFSVGEQTLTLSRYLEETATDGFLVLHKGRIVYERYLDRFTERQPHIWASMTKSVTGLLAAQLIAEGKLDPNARLSSYVPELVDTPFGDATVQQNLDMAVAVSYPGNVPPDIGLFAATGIVPRKPGMPATIYDFLKVAGNDAAQAGKPLFFYQNGSPEAVAWAISRVTGQSWSRLVSERIWSQFAVDDADMLVDEQGIEMASGGLSSSLRDAGRFAEAVRLALGEDSRKDPFARAVQLSFAPHDNRDLIAAGSKSGERTGYSYHNYWYQKNDGDGSLEAAGRFGQKIYINPARELVIVKLASAMDLAPRATQPGASQARGSRAIDSQKAFNNLVTAVLRVIPN
ncbi:serine hydrolase domain-containing protein [Pseudomonas sp. CR3202]|uniref:serine hydrolase domain-containing protein n=1 Tax=Pseudomonas sp. CR3202 TaxID=3351532 RepID=UPI003BF19E1E